VTTHGASAAPDLTEELARSRAEIERRADSERALREITGALVAIREPARLLQLVVDEASRLVGADGTILALLDPERRFLSWSFDDGLRERFDPEYVATLTLDVGIGVTGRAIVDGRAIVVNRDLIDEFPRTPESLHFFHVSGFRAMVAVPIVGEDGALGALEVYSRREDAFDDADAAILQALASQAAIALTNARLIEELARSRAEVERRADSERTLREIAARLTAIRDPGELLQLVVEEAARLLDGDRSQIDLLDPGTGLLHWAYPLDGAGPDRTGAPGQPTDVGVAGRAIATGEPFLTGDYLPDDRFVHDPETDRIIGELGLRSIVVAPLRGDAGLLGVLQVGARSADAFDASDAVILEALANQASVAITNARLIEELARSRREVERRAEAERALREIGARLTEIRDPGDLLQQAVEAAARLLRGDGALLDLIDPASGMIRWAYDSGIEDEQAREILRRLELPVGVGMFGRAIAERRVLATPDYMSDDRFSHAAGADEFARRVGYRSFVAAPLIAESGVLGVLGVYASGIDAFDEADIALLGAFADQATVAIVNSRLIDELARSRQEIERRAEAERTLREITARITALRDPGEVLQQVVDESKRLLGSDGAHLTLIAEDRTVLHPVVVAGGADAAADAWLKTQEFPVGGGMNGLAAATSRPVWTFDYLEDPRIPHESDDQDVARRFGLRGMAVAPLRATQGESIGTLAVSYLEPRDFSDDEIELLQGLADQAAIAVTNLGLYDRLAQSESRYRLLVQSSPDLIWAADLDGRFTFMSDRSVEFFGLSPSELIGGHWAKVVHPDSLAEANARWAGVLADPSRPQHVRLVLLGPGGRPLSAELSTIALTDDRGRATGALGSVRDVTNQARLERELRESEARFRYLVETSPDVIWQVDADGSFTYLSDTARAVLGWAPEQLVGRHFSVLVAPRSSADAAETWGRIVASPSGVENARISLLRADGSEVPTEIYSISAVEDGRFVGAHGSIRDIAERDRLERDLRQQAAELAAGDERAHLARELHDSVTQGLFSMTLLTRSIELLLQRDPAAAAEKLADLRELQRDALAETRALIFELRPSSLDQDGLVKALRTHAAAVQGRIGLPVVIEADDIGRLPHSAEDALYRIAQEALHNVVKHANARHVRIGLTASSRDVRLAVEDDGIGFDPSTVPSGHLGLAGMRARADKVGGTLTVTSRPGGGTRIEVSVPAQAGAAE
jgi:PAS domain S-box-containing protein